MDNHDPTWKYLLPVFIAMAVFLLAAFQEPGEGQFILNPPTPEPLCDCSADLYDCSDFATQLEAQQCVDSCWVATGVDVHRLDTDRGFLACEYVARDVLSLSSPSVTCTTGG